jgi:hypothetical protein
MNPIIEAYFDAIELRLIQTPIVIAYQIISRAVSVSDGKLRVRAVLIDGGLAELFEYVHESEGQIRLSKYSFHWQDKQGRLKCRWDNAPHYPNLSNAPHHIHRDDGTIQESLVIPTMAFVILHIEQEIKETQ